MVLCLDQVFSLLSLELFHTIGSHLVFDQLRVVVEVGYRLDSALTMGLVDTQIVHIGEQGGFPMRT